MKKNFFGFIFLLFYFSCFSAEIIAIQVTGTGENVEKAVSNGLKQAVEIAVGSIIRAYSEVDETITITSTDISADIQFKEKILSFSKAYIQNYQISEYFEEDGLVYAEMNCEVRLDALEASILRNGIGMAFFEGSKLLYLFERNKLTEWNAGEMASAIFKDFSFPAGLWGVSEIKTEIKETTPESVKAEFTITVKPDEEKFRGFLSEFEELLKNICEKEITEKVKFEELSGWKTTLLSNFLYDPNYRNVIRIFSGISKNSIEFREYYLDSDTKMEKQILDSIKDFYNGKNSYSLKVLFFNQMKEKIFLIEGIKATEKNLLLSRNNFGFSSTSQKGLQYFITTGNIRIEPGKIRFSQEDLRFVIEADIPRDIFTAIEKIECRIIEE